MKQTDDIVTEFMIEKAKREASKARKVMDAFLSDKPGVSLAQAKAATASLNRYLRLRQKMTGGSGRVRIPMPRPRIPMPRRHM